MLGESGAEPPPREGEAWLLDDRTMAHDECVRSRVVCRLSGKVPFEMTPKES